MMRCRDGWQFSVACLLMAALIGLTGFVIIYHYATFERPLQQFAIVIDAGSTQTRSGLFSVEVDLPKLIDLAQNFNDREAFETIEEVTMGGEDGRQMFPLTDLFQATQIGSCVNGGPLASVKTESGAQELLSQCLIKFSDQIRRLEGTADVDEYQESLGLPENETDELAKKAARVNNRVNSLTHLYLGATAGMRALEELNQNQANQIIYWIDSAVNQSNKLVRKTLGNGPYINKGSVEILSGDDEAKFTWISVNFVCERLQLQLAPYESVSVGHSTSVDHQLIDAADTKNTNSLYYHYNTHENQAIGSAEWVEGIMRKQEFERYTRRLRQTIELNDVLNSVGTVELGGASAQIAYRVPSWLSKDQVANNSLTRQSFELFNVKYALATRSDLCLGASQAILRVEYLIMRDLYGKSQLGGTLDATVENPCLQNGAHKTLDLKQLVEFLNSPCLVPGKSSEFEYQSFKNFLTVDKQQQQQATRAKGVNFLGTGDTRKCHTILNRLLDAQQCRQYFSICPVGSGLDRNGAQKLIEPPSTMPFVTVAGYNKALQVLKLTKSDTDSIERETKQVVQLEQLISEKLGGHSIDYRELVSKTQEFCQTQVSELSLKYPLVSSRLIATTCLSLLYIDKMLTNYYKFDPKTTWKQLKFLLFQPGQQSSSDQKQLALTKESKQVATKQQSGTPNDIGWTLGLLLNATSQQERGIHSGAATFALAPIFHHHKTSYLFLIRGTIFFMLASVMLAMSVLLVAAIAVKRKNRERTSYIAHQDPVHSYGRISMISSQAI